MSEFLVADDEDYDLGDIPPDVNGGQRERLPFTEPAEPLADDGRGVDPKFVADPQQTTRSKRYEKKARVPILMLARRLAAKPATVADAAAIVHSGPELSRAFGDAADSNAQIRRVVDWVSEGTTSPTIALVTALTGLTVQIARNHQEALKPKRRRIKLGRRSIETREIGYDMSAAGPMLDLISNDPELLAQSIFASDEYAELFRSWVIAL